MKESTGNLLKELSKSGTLKTSSGQFKVTEHTLKRMSKRHVSVKEITNAIERGQRFSYHHEGVWKVGYYDPKTKTFVATRSEEIKTVIKGSGVEKYVKNLIKKSIEALSKT